MAHELRHNAGTTSMRASTANAHTFSQARAMQSFSSSVGHLAGLVSRRTLLADGLVEAAVQFRDGHIAACDANPTRGMLDCGDLLVLPGMPKDVAIDRAETYRRAFSQASIEHGDVRMHATLSIGVSSTSDHLTTPEALIAHADAALYQAKALGRDRVVSSSAAIAAEV